MEKSDGVSEIDRAMTFPSMFFVRAFVLMSNTHDKRDYDV